MSNKQGEEVKLLLVEDEPLLVENLKNRFKKLDFIIDCALDGEQGLYLGIEYDYDLIILDLGLPKIPGLMVLEKLRAANIYCPILILTARNSWQERVEGLNLGADDYLGKPFHFEELLARVQSIVKRNKPKNIQVCLTAKEDESEQVFCLDTESKSLIIDNKEHTLTATEYQILRLFFNHPNQVFSKQKLLERISDNGQEKDDNIIEVYIGRLRRHLGKNAIQTLRGQGYRLTLIKAAGTIQ